MKKTDVLIVGAGISGLSSALFLSKHGISVTVIEKKDRVGTKPCAGGLTFKSLKLIKSLIEPNITRYIKKNKIASIFLKNKKIKKILSPFPYSIILRRQLDILLYKKLNKKNCNIYFSEKIKSIDLKKNILITKSGKKIAFKFLIGADGVFSFVRKMIKGNRRFKSFFNTASAVIPSDSLKKKVDDMEFYFGENKKGYKWIFNGGSFYSFGCGGHEDVISLEKKLLRSINKKTLIKKIKIYHHPIPISNRIFYGNKNVLLLGDAAGLAGGLYGEGIFNALISSFVAANTIRFHFAGNKDLDDLAYIYRKNMKIALGNTLVIENLLAQVYYTIMEITKGYLLLPLIKTLSLPILYTGHEKFGIPGINKTLGDVF